MLACELTALARPVLCHCSKCQVFFTPGETGIFIIVEVFTRVTVVIVSADTESYQCEKGIETFFPVPSAEPHSCFQKSLNFQDIQSVDTWELEQPHWRSRYQGDFLLAQIM